MRSISLFSAALCGILWILSDVGSVAADTTSVDSGRGKNGQDQGGDCSRYPDADCYKMCMQSVNPALLTNCLTGATTLTTDQTPPIQTGAIDTTTTGTTTTGPAFAVIPITTATSLPGVSVVPSTTLISDPPTATPTPVTGLGAGEISDSPKNGTVTQAVSVGNPSKKKSNTGPIVGGVIGGIALLALIFLVAFFLWRRRRRASVKSHDFGALEKNRESSPSVYPITGISTYDTPSPPPQLLPAPAITPVESHHLMGGYSEPNQPASGEIVPVVGAAKPYAVNTQREVDEDGVSLRSPSPVQDGGRGSGERDSVPRLPIYNRSGGTTDRGPAL